MKARVIGLTLLVGIGMGAIGGEAVHSQARPPAYLIGEIQVSNPEGYAKEYLPKARETSKRTVGN